MLLDTLMKGFDWAPLTNLESWHREIDRLFNGHGVSSFPRVNVSMDENVVHVVAEVPGINKDDLEISVHKNTLTLRGSRKPEKLGDEETMIRRERPHGEFERVLDLQVAIDATKVTAAYRDGILTITIPRAEESRPRKITIR